MPTDLDTYDNDIEESDISDDEDESNQHAIPESFVDYLILRYKPHFDNFFGKFQSVGRYGCTLAGKAAWHFSTSMLIYVVPLAIASERHLMWEQRGKGSSESFKPPAAGSTTAPTTEGPKMVGPPGS
uniref:Mitochondrial import receptor subunit tom22 n=1 Tax=Lotharella globosa TaxID=91324 RepID=A0A6U3AK77_9EUKA|mmetsp:Transcript_24952/g.48739  ORF Transcript_24952/g.48739 Transcript_24952/m.48739 type:complete len:127 (+) Transcript_24952:47-427(+)